MEKKTKIVLVSITVVGIIIVGSLLWLISSTCDRFPKNYDIADVKIQSEIRASTGAFEIIIYGNGTAFFLDQRGWNEDIIWEDDSGMVYCFEARYGKLSNSTIQELIDLFERNGFFCLDNNYEDYSGGTEKSYYYITITINNETKTVMDENKNAPHSYQELFDKILNSVENLPIVTEDNKEIFCNERLRGGFMSKDYCLICIDAMLSK